MSDLRDLASLRRQRDQTSNLLAGIDRAIANETGKECTDWGRVAELQAKRDKWALVFANEATAVGNAANDLSAYGEYATVCGALFLSGLTP